MRIGGILSRVTHSVNGRRILKGIIAGDACEDILGGLSWHVRKKLDLLGDALSFELDMQSRWILSDLLAQFDSDTGPGRGQWHCLSESTVRISVWNSRIRLIRAFFVGFFLKFQPRRARFPSTAGIRLQDSASAAGVRGLQGGIVGIRRVGAVLRRRVRRVSGGPAVRRAAPRQPLGLWVFCRASAPICSPVFSIRGGTSGPGAAGFAP